MRYVKYLALIFLLCVGGKAFAQGMGYGYPTMPQFHSAGGGGGGGAASPTATITVPTAVATTGNVFTTMTGASATTHDMEVCYIIESSSQNQLLTSSGLNMAGWGVMDGTIGLMKAGLWTFFAGHCVEPSDASTYTFQNLANTSSTAQACLLLRNTHCGQDGAANETATGTSTTINYGSLVAHVANEMFIYGTGWDNGADSVSANPAGVVVGVAVNANGIQIGYRPQAAATTVAATTGTLSGSANNIGGIAAIVP